MEEDKYKIKEFAEEANTTERTARYYVKEGLIDPPEGSRRGAFYTDEHVEQLEEVKAMKEDGMKIEEIKDEIEEESSGIRFSITPPKDDYSFYTPPKKDNDGCLMNIMILLLISLIILILN